MRLPLFTAANTTINLLLMFLLIVNIGDALFSPLMAVFITRSVEGGTLATVGFCLAIYSVVKSLVQIPIARIIDAHKGERDDFSLLLIGSILTMIVTYSYMFVRVEYHLFILSTISGISVAFMMAAYYAIFSRHVDKGKESYEWSLLSVGPLTVASAIGASIGGMFTDRFGFHLTFFVAGSLCAMATASLMFLYPILWNPKARHKIKTRA